MRPRSRVFFDRLRDLHSQIDYIFFRLFKHPKPIKPETIKRILCVELLYIGDLIVTTPAIRALKETFPDSEITFLLPKGMGPVLERNPNITHIIEIDQKPTKIALNQLSMSLRGMQFDMGVLFYPGNRQISKLLKKSKIPIRVGCSKTGFLEGKGHYLTHKVKPTKEKKHYVEENLDVVRTIGAEASNTSLEIYPNADLKVFFNKHEIREKDLVIIVHPGPQNSTHKWVNVRFSAVIDALIEKYNAKVILTGNKKDEGEIQEIRNTTKNQVITAVGMNLNQFFSLVQRADLVISVDTGAMHVSAALECPTVALFGAGDPKVWRPYAENVRVLYKPTKCTSCMRYKCKFDGERKMECMRAITVEEVLSASEELLKLHLKKEIKIPTSTTQEILP